MADRQALRDLQTRLAARLQASQQAAADQASWLAVRAGGLDCLLPLAQSGGIFPAVAAHPVPYSQPWFLGVANLRGALLGVVDLAAFMAGACGAVTAGTTDRTDSRLVALGADLGVPCALRIDRLAGLRAASAFPARADPPEGAPPWWAGAYIDPDGGRWQALDLQALSRQPQFLAIGA